MSDIDTRKTKKKNKYMYLTLCNVILELVLSRLNVDLSKKNAKIRKNQSKNKLKSYISSFLCPDCVSPAIINDQNKIFTCIKKKKIFIKS